MSCSEKIWRGSSEDLDASWTQEAPRGLDCAKDLHQTARKPKELRYTNSFFSLSQSFSLADLHIPNRVDIYVIVFYRKQKWGQLYLVCSQTLCNQIKTCLTCMLFLFTSKLSKADSNSTVNIFHILTVDGSIGQMLKVSDVTSAELQLFTAFKCRISTKKIPKMLEMLTGGRMEILFLKKICRLKCSCLQSYQHFCIWVVGIWKIRNLWRILKLHMYQIGVL